jgi:hypothetical protein
VVYRFWLNNIHILTHSTKEKSNKKEKVIIVVDLIKDSKTKLKA